MKDYFYPSNSTIYVFICFTFRGIIALSYWDLQSIPVSNVSSIWELIQLLIKLSTAGKKREWINTHFDE